MYETILLPLDLNETSSWEKALPAAADLCRVSGGTLHVMTVVPGYGMNLVGQYFPEGAEEAAEAAALDELKNLTAELVPKDIALEHSVVQGAVHEQNRGDSGTYRRRPHRHGGAGEQASPISCSATMPTEWYAATGSR